jgi:hypothetical protein
MDKGEITGLMVRKSFPNQGTDIKEAKIKMFPFLMLRAVRLGLEPIQWLAAAGPSHRLTAAT